MQFRKRKLDAKKIAWTMKYQKILTSDPKISCCKYQTTDSTFETSKFQSQDNFACPNKRIGGISLSGRLKLFASILLLLLERLVETKSLKSRCGKVSCQFFPKDFREPFSRFQRMHRIVLYQYTYLEFHKFDVKPII